MKESNGINGFQLYHSLLSGYESLLGAKRHLNDINVFPVADGDTGNNMVATVRATLQVPRVFRSLSKTLSALADRSLSSARGNSGIIIAQFINGISDNCPDKPSVSAEEFGDALSKAAYDTGKAIENPREGTLLTVLHAWTAEFRRLSARGGAMKDHFVESLEAARAALRETTDQLDVLKKAGVVDAGASGFVSFLEGIARMLVTGKASWERSSFAAEAADSAEYAHDIPESSGEIAYRYCTEALVLHEGKPPEHLADDLRRDLRGFGDSLIISSGRNKTKIHVHTNEPAKLFFALKDSGRIVEQKVDDMVRQYRAVHAPVSRVAVVTDSIADVPPDLVDRYQIHVIPLKILWGEDEYLDRLTIDAETFYPYLDSRKDYPGSSIPDPVRVDQVFSWLSSHYESVIAIPVGKALSGTWQVMRRSADALSANGYRVSVVDSKLNSAAQGLVVLAAAEDAANGLSHDDILARTEERIRGARILVSVATFKYMVRGGRISALKGAIAAMTHLKPVITLDGAGKGVAYGASFTQKASLAKILSEARNKAAESRYAVVHAACPERAAEFAEEVASALGRKCEYIMEISPIVGIHAGVGAVALAWIPLVSR